MKHLNRTVLFMMAVCVFGSSGVGQTPSSPQVVPVARPGKIATYFNADRNVTTVVLGFSDVGGESPCGLYLSANSSYPGKVAAAPREITLVMMRITPEERIKSAPLRDLTFVSDGEVMNLGLMETASQQTNMDLRLETLQLSVPYDSFLKISNAKSVEAKLGSAKFALTENNLTFMRQFAKRFKP